MLGKFVTVRTPINLTELERELAAVARVQFDQELQDDEYSALAGLLERHPAVTLRAYGFSEELASLRFLQWFPSLARFSLSGLHKVSSLENLRLLPEDLSSLDVGETSAKVDLRPATRFRHLKQLRVVGHSKGLNELLESLQGLSALSLWRLPIDRVSKPPHLSRTLESIALTLGSLKDPDWILGLDRLRYVAVRAVKGVEAVGWVGRLPKMEYLWLDDLPKLDVLPELTNNRALARLDLTGLHALRDPEALEPIVQAPAIEELLITESRVPPQAFSILKKSKTLRRVGVGLGNAHRNEEAMAILKLQPPSPLDRFAERRGLIAVM
ncbi:hypothetical protein AB0K27_10250 [Micromonospora echinospora]|uniref:hypothetical protein n=1 Tax=Micromonospora TaxID=1873 RepID=UPI00126015B2|nr:hypothetical protein [Micromonospora sp. B006]